MRQQGKIYARRFVEVIVLILLFCGSFICLEKVLHYRWTGNENLYARNIDYANQKPLDIAIVGTSETYASIDPIVLYKNKGITGYNLCTSNTSAITQYFQVKYILKVNKPRVLVCDFSALYIDNLPSEKESLYRKVVECMPDKSIKNELIFEICKIDDSQKIMYWLFPLLRYHSMWNELSNKNFENDYVYDKDYKQCTKGALLRDKEYTPKDNIAIQTSKDIVSDLWDAEESFDPFSELSLLYYDKMIEACNEEGISVVAYIPPKLSQAKVYTARYPQMEAYFSSRGVTVYNYNTYQQVTRMGLVLEEDYYDQGHVNVSGSKKTSIAFADDLAKDFVFEDKRNNPDIANEWNALVDEFENAYGVIGD